LKIHLFVALLLSATSLLVGGAPAAAGPAAQAFDAGRFAEAAVAGRKEGTAQSLVVAGRGISTVAAFQTTDRKKAREQLLQAERDFDAALALQPGHPDAQLQKAIAIGYRAKLENNIGLAKQARKNFEALLAKRPNDALVLGALGGWHGEAIATLGKFLAGTALGANAKDGQRYYDKAVASPGADPAVPVFYATTLLNLSPDNAPRARALLQRAVKAPANDGFEQLMQQNARAILAPLEKGDVEAARAEAKRLGPLGTLR
jgi:tetratricopeptide (TPR) repeat protein